MKYSISMNVWPSRPVPVKPADWQDISRQKTLAVLSYRALCDRAGVPPRVTGADMDRQVHILTGGQHIRPIGLPDAIGVALPRYRGRQSDALRILEILAHGFLDYAAREAVRGCDLFVPTAGCGRKSTGKALSGAERMRRLRSRDATTLSSRRIPKSTR